MATQNLLPDPNHKITQSGDNANTGTTGPGFASVKFASNMEIMRDRTNGGVLISRYKKYQMWNINISYNPMTREEFDPVYGFLLQRQGSLQPFKVSLPQYKDTSASNVAVENRTSSSNDYTAGQSQLRIATSSFTPSVGDLFHITDTSDSNHTKAYKVTRVETTSSTLTDQDETADDPASNIARITFTPPLQKGVDKSASTVNFSEPLVQVVQRGNVVEYSLGTNNLYEFSLNLEEACY